MKNSRNIWDYIFRPFQFVAGGKALILGIVTMFVLVALCYASNTFFDGAIDAHYGCKEKAILPHVYCVFGVWVVMTVLFYLTALLAGSKKTRLIDIAGTLALAKLPLIVFALIGFLPMTKALCGLDLTNFNPMDTETTRQIMMVAVKMLPTLFVCLLAVIWYIVLMYNGYSVSVNLRGTKGILTFIAALLVSEILAKMLLGIVL
ncbi:MAG: YIP1 family protein [Prevotellaceae bacterium]|jgi:hypothetical protein|nr:YIP1 family protein [Prevotellaceae bacterium]